MAVKKGLKTSISTVALSALVWTGALGAVPYAAAATNPFSDVTAGYWAEKHIVKLALQDIIRGSEGKFRPGDTVKREDAVIVALKFMGLAENIDTSAAIAFPSSFHVDDYAKAYVIEAFKRKLLLTNEEYALANSEKGKSWGQAKASREWVARLLVRAIGKEADALDNVGKATAFSDNGKMDAALRAYVLTAVQQGLVYGVTPTTFEPKLPINRASIATLFSKAESKISVAYSGQVSGVLLSIDTGKLTVLHDNGIVQDYTIAPGTLIARYDSDKRVPVTSLRLYGTANLIAAADGSLSFVEQTDDTAKVKSVDGTLSRLNEGEAAVWLLIGDNYQKYTYDSAHAPIVTDSQGKSMALKDIPEGSAISLKMDTVRKEPKIVAVSVKQTVINKTGSGVVTTWDAATGKLLVSDAVTGAAETLNVSPDAKYKEDNIFVDKADLKSGLTISYEVKNSFVVSVQWKKPAQTAIAGNFLSVDKTLKLISFTENGQLKSKFLADSAAVKIDGLSDAGLDDLQKDDSIAMTLNDNDKVTQITVSGRIVQTLTGATVAQYVDDTNTLSLKDAAGKAYNLFLTSNVRYEMNGTKMEASAALPLLTKGKKITVGYSGSNAITVSIIAKYSGTVVEHNTTAKTLKVKLDADHSVSLIYVGSTVEAYGQTSASASDIKVGDEITVLLNNSQDLVTTIQVHKAVQFQVISVDASTGKIRMKKSGSSSVEELTVPSATTLQNEAGAAVALDHFAPGSIVNATFQGKTPVKIKGVDVTFGKVVSINTAASTVDMLLTNGTTVTKPVTSSPVIVRDNATYNSLSSVQPDDRVELRKDENDRTFIQVVPALRKTFWYYDATNRTVNVQHSANEDYSYPLDTQVYIHQSSNLLTTGDLKLGDAISLYVWNGKVVEIAK